MELSQLLHYFGFGLFAMPFLYFGYNHFKNVDSLSGYAESSGIPMPRLVVVMTGLLFLSVGILIPIRNFIPIPNLTSWLLGCLALFLIISATKIHSDKAEVDDFLKNISLAGASLMLIGLFQ